ncbi:phosphatase 2C-like domain-containing protein [Mycena sp. CBHHK59/15]|nr:phosphatase 2C-like domain-containing protein [Mycena sp. CBHHK59/15]
MEALYQKYDEKASKMAEVLPGGIAIHQATLQTKNEDRTAVFQFEHGTIIAIFDGHYSSELSEFASKTLPLMLSERIEENVDVEAVMTQTIEEFDRSLLSKVTELFDPDEDWSGERWLDRGNIHEVIGYGQQDVQFRAGRRAIVGATALIGFIDKEREQLWVASLGDSDAVCGRMKNGKWIPTILSDRHNCKNMKEVDRLGREHPNEQNLVVGNRILGLLAVTRALGDHQFKAPFFLASRVMSYFYPSYILDIAFEDWERDGHLNPPYLSSTPVVCRHDLLPGDMLVFASDGLRDSMDPQIPEADRWDIIISLANGADHVQLGHPCIQPMDGDNAAERVIKNVLFGTDIEKMAKELDDACERDDISVVVVNFE